VAGRGCLLKSRAKTDLAAHAAVQSSQTTSWWHFIRHFAEMVAAMIVGMAVLAPAWVRIFALLGYSSLLKNAV
jgi:hypothetical protein